MKIHYFALFFVFFLLLNFLAFASLLCNLIYPHYYQNEIKTFSNLYGVDSALVFSIVKAESNFDSGAVSSVGAVGLMQLMPTTAVFIAQKINFTQTIDLYNPQTNLHLGIAYISYLQNRFNNLKAVICAYNAGEGVVKTWLNENGEVIKIEFAETRNYYNKVQQAMKVYS